MSRQVLEHYENLGPHKAWTGPLSRGDYGVVAANEEAIAQYHEAIRLLPDFLEALNNLAWTLAASPDAQFRNASEAIQLATRACELTGWKDPGCLNSLAAACAESGDYESAVKWQSRAVELLPIDNKLRPVFRRRLFIYEAKHPNRD